MQKLIFTLALLFSLEVSHAQAQLVEVPHGAPNLIQVFQDTVWLAGYSLDYRFDLFRSTDFGRHWQALPDSLHTQPYYFGQSFDLADGRLYLDGDQQLRFSTDLGQSWQNYEHAATKGNVLPKAYWRDTVLMIKDQHYVVRALPSGGVDTVWNNQNSNGPLPTIERFGDRIFIWEGVGLYFSDNGGTTWTMSDMTVYDGVGLPSYQQKIVQAGNRLFAWRYYPNGYYSRVYRSDDFGLTWIDEPQFSNNTDCWYRRMYRSNRATYIKAECDVNNSSVITIWRLPDDDTQWEIHQPYFAEEYLLLETDSLRLLTDLSRLLRSTNDGASWQACPADGGRMYGQYFVWPDGSAVFMDDFGAFQRPDSLSPYTFIQGATQVGGMGGGPCQQFAAQWQDSVVLACQAYLSYSFDRGATWSNTWAFPANRQLYEVYWDADGLWGRIRINNNQFYIAHWSFLNHAWEDLRPLPYSSTQGRMGKMGHHLFLGTGTNTIAISTDLGQTWQDAPNPPAGNVAFYYAYVAGNTVLIRDDLSARIYISKDNGLSWHLARTNYGQPFVGFLSIVGHGDDLFADLSNYGAYSPDGGLTWFISQGGTMPRIFSDDSLVYYAVQNRLFRNSLTWFNQQGIAAVNAFYDLNGDGIQDAGEPPYAGAVAYMPTASGITDSLGHTALWMAEVGDTIRVYPPRPDVTVMPGFQVITGQTIPYAFALQFPYDTDLAVDLNNHGPARPGFKGNYTLSVFNGGNKPQQTLLKTVFDPAFTLVQATPPPTQIAGDTLCWQWNGFQPFSRESVSLQWQLSASTPLGNTVKNIAWVSSANTDGNPLDNRDTLLQTVFGSYDPNDKQVQPAGNLTPLEVQQGAELNYTIRFQNTGTYPAENILVVDSLQADLDWRSFQLRASSHPCKVTLYETGVVAFYFEHIQLPDSLKDQAGSHGFVQFAIRPNTGLPLGTEIYNDAQIFFDYNQPVNTNSTYTPVAEDTVSAVKNPDMRDGNDAGFGLSVLPNPFSTELQVKVALPHSGALQMKLLDAQGRTLLLTDPVRQLPGEQAIRLQVGTIPSGMYWLECRFGDAVRKVKVIRQ